MIIQRELTKQIFHWLDKNKILLIKGSRQVGKTTLLKIIEEKLKEEGKKTFYLSIDQEFGNPILEQSKNFWRFLQDQYSLPKSNDKLYVFLDEFQYLKNAGIFLKTLFDQAEDSIQIIASGSSSLEITKNAEFLTGRKIQFNLYPLNYREFLSYKSNLKLPESISLNKFDQVKDFFAVYKESLYSFLLEYFSFGGYPEVVKTPVLSDKTTILKELIRTYVEKDIIAFLRIENVKGFSDLLKILCAQIGNLVNKSELSNTTNLSMDTLNKYLDILEGTYVIELLKPYFTNIRKELSKMPKIYIGDFGLRNVVLNKTSLAEYADGQERENFVYNSLKDRFGKENVKFYRTISKAEIDFILERDQELIPIEVKSIKKSITLPKAVRFFQQEHPKNKQAIIITDDLLEKNGNKFLIPLPLLPFIEF